MDKSKAKEILNVVLAYHDIPDARQDAIVEALLVTFPEPLNVTKPIESTVALTATPIAGSNALDTTTLEVNKYQIGGDHYAAEFQHWDWVAEVFGAAYFVGTITKYVTRWRKKNGVEDLRKALHYHHKLVELIKAGKLPMVAPVDNLIGRFPNRNTATLEFFNQHPDLGEHEKQIFYLAFDYEDLEDLEQMYMHIDGLLHEAKAHRVQFSID